MSTGATEKSLHIYLTYSEIPCFLFLQLNSYQVIIATDSHTSYVVFIYNRVEWSSPDSTGVAGTGIGAEPSKLPVMGISDGKSIEQLVAGSEEPRDEDKILNVEVDNGNTGIPGMWIFEASAPTQSTQTSECVPQ